MAIRVSHTPYGAVGKLAQAAGEAQQAVREQDYSFRASQQAKQINASLQSQRERIGAEMQMQDQRMEQQQVQWGEELEFKNSQLEAQQASTGFQFLTQKKQLRQQAEQFEEQMTMKENAFQLETAMADRRLNIAEQTSELQVNRFLDDQQQRSDMMQTWQELEGTVDEDTYTNGMLAIQGGKLPQLPDPQLAKLMSDAQKASLDLKRKQMYLKQKQYEQANADKRLDKDTKKQFAALAEKLLVTPTFRAATGKARGYDAVPAYERYTSAINYGALGEVQKNEADTIFMMKADKEGADLSVAEAFMETIRNSHWRYIPVSQRAETYLQPVGGQQTSAPVQTQQAFSYDVPKGEGRKITNDVVFQYMQKANGNADVARQLAKADGWTF